MYREASGKKLMIQKGNLFMQNFIHVNAKLIFINLINVLAALVCTNSGLDGARKPENIINLQYRFCNLKIASKLQFFPAGTI